MCLRRAVRRFAVSKINLCGFGVQGDALAIGNLGVLYVRGQGVKENKVAGVALLLVSKGRRHSFGACLTPGHA
jgi:hypothetical protein